jgi:hypothetical protein
MSLVARGRLLKAKLRRNRECPVNGAVLLQELPATDVVVTKRRASHGFGLLILNRFPH